MAAPACSVCQDMRFVYAPDPQAPVTGMRVVRCPACGQQSQQQRLQRYSGLAPEMAAWTFANTVRTGLNQAAYDAAQELAARPRWFLTLEGDNGVGKTRLLAALVNAGLGHGWTSVYTTTADLLDHLRATFEPDAEAGFDSLWERLMQARILALDEFDRWNPTPWAEEKFFQLVDHRYRHGAELLTAFATNSPVDALAPYLASRLRDQRCRYFVLLGADKRAL